MDVDSYNHRHRLYFFNTGSIIKSGIFAVYLLHLSRLVLNGASSFRLLKNPQSTSETATQPTKHGSISRPMKYLIKTLEIAVFLS